MKARVITDGSVSILSWALVARWVIQDPHHWAMAHTHIFLCHLLPITGILTIVKLPRQLL